MHLNKKNIGRQASSLSGAVHVLAQDAYCCCDGHNLIPARCVDKCLYQVYLSVGLTQIIYRPADFIALRHIVQYACCYVSAVNVDPRGMHMGTDVRSAPRAIE